MNHFSCDAYTLLVVELMDIIALKPQSVSHSRVKSNHENAGEDYQDHPQQSKGFVHPVLRPGINTLISLLHKFIHQEQWRVEYERGNPDTRNNNLKYLQTT